MVRRVFLVLLPTILAGCGTAQRGAMLRAYSAIKQRRYDDALVRLSEAEQYQEPTPELRAEIAFLRARSYEGLNRLSDAAALYRYLVAVFPQSPYSYQARERLRVLDK